MKKNLFRVLICLFAVFVLMSMTAAAEDVQAAGEAVQVTVEPAEVQTNEPITVSFTVPANNYSTRVNFYRDGNLTEMRTVSTDENGFAELTFHSKQPGHYTVEVESHLLGVDEVRVGSAEFDVTAPNGKLDVPILSTNDPELGQDLVLSFQPVANADSYTIDFHGGDIHKHVMVNPHQLQMIIPASDLTAGDYSFAVAANTEQPGYLDSSSSMVVPVREKDKKLTLSVDKTEVQASENVVITLNAPGAYYVRMYDNGEVNSTYQMMSSSLILTRKLKSGTHNIWFVASYEPSTSGSTANFGNISNTITVTAKGDGAMKEPTFTVTPVDTIGDHVLVTIDQAEDGLVEYQLSLLAVPAYREMSKVNIRHEGAGTFTAEIPTLAMEAGLDYILRAECTKLGKDPFSRMYSSTKFTIQNPATEPMVDCYPTEILANENYTFLIEAGGYPFVRLDYAGQGSNWSNVYSTPNMTITFGGRQEGTDVLTMYVSNDQETWTKVGTSIIKISAPNGQLGNIDLGLKSHLIQPGEDLVVNVKPVEGATTQQVYIEGDGVSEFAQLTADNMQVTIPASKLKPLSFYDISSWAFSNVLGVGGSTLDTRVFVGGDYGKTITLPADLKQIDESALEDVSASCVVVPEGVTTIGRRAFANCSNLRYVFLPSTVTSIASDAFAGCKDLIIFADANNNVAYTLAKNTLVEFVAIS